MVDRLVSNDLVGKVIGNYRVGRVLEQGGWGPVFQVYAQTGTRYLMRFSEQLTLGAENERMAAARLVFLGHFQHEASLIAMLQHPHILPLLDYGNFHGRPYLVYPQLASSSLEAVLTRQGALPLELASQYLYEITSALEYAHERAVLHRNLSPACIYIHAPSRTSQPLEPIAQPRVSDEQSLLGDDGQASGHVLVAEFGLRRIIEVGRQDLRGNADVIKPRPAYDGSIETSAPEQLLGQLVDTYTDVYACGAILYRMLTGHAPFEGQTRDEVARQHLYVQVPPLQAWCKDVPGALNGVLKKALEKDPAQRYRRPAELFRAYQRALAMPVAPQPTPTDVVASRLSLHRLAHSTGTQTGIPRRRLFALAGALGSVAVAGYLLGTHFLGEQAPVAGQGASSTANPARPTGTLRQLQKTQGVQSPAVQPPSTDRKVLARAADVPANSAKTFEIAGQQRPGVLVHLVDASFVAFDSTCTHAGCGVDYNPQTRLLECPCHGAAFDPAQKAAVVSGPAQAPLAEITIQVQPDGTITLKK